MFYIIPLTPSPDQYFNCSIPVDNKNINLFFRLRYNTVAQYWTATISNTAGVLLIDSLPLLYNEYPAANLLGQYAHLGIGSAYLIKNGKSDSDRPDDTNLGTDFLLVWGDTNV